MKNRKLGSNARQSKQQSGQGLIEYLILMCLISVSAIAVVSIVGQNIKARYANISSTLQGKKGQFKTDTVNKNSIESSDFGNFDDTATRQSGW